MKDIVIFNSEEESLAKIKSLIQDLQKKYGYSRCELSKKVKSNQELETDEVIDDLMLWRALELSKDQKLKSEYKYYERRTASEGSGQGRGGIKKKM